MKRRVQISQLLASEAIEDRIESVIDKLRDKPHESCERHEPQCGREDNTNGTSPHKDADAPGAEFCDLDAAWNEVVVEGGDNDSKDNHTATQTIAPFTDYEKSKLAHTTAKLRSRNQQRRLLGMDMADKVTDNESHCCEIDDMDATWLVPEGQAHLDSPDPHPDINNPDGTTDSATCLACLLDLGEMGAVPYETLPCRHGPFCYVCLRGLAEGAENPQDIGGKEIGGTDIRSVDAGSEDAGGIGVGGTVSSTNKTRGVVGACPHCAMPVTDIRIRYGVG
jgi:hypothetical protein